MTRELRAEIGNIATHALGILMSVIALGIGVWSLSHLRAAPLAHAALWIYGLCAVALYTASTVYHSLFAAPLARKVARRFDHAAIYLMIAGSYTPFLWITLPNRGGFTWSIVIWGSAIVGIIFKVFYAGRFKTISTLLYLAMGWLAVVMWPDLTASLPTAAIHLLLAGGVVYTLGSIFYLWQKLPYQHVIWHVCVLAGSILQWLAIQLYVLPLGGLL